MNLTPETRRQLIERLLASSRSLTTTATLPVTAKRRRALSFSPKAEVGANRTTHHKERAR